MSTLWLLAKTLSVSLDELMAKGESQVQQKLERISPLPKPKRRALMDVIEALLAQQGH